MKHRFITDPNIDINALKSNNETIARLKQFITSEEGCSVVGDIGLYQVTYDKNIVDGIAAYTEKIKLQVSAKSDITKSIDRVEKLAMCFDDVINGIGKDSEFENSLQLNLSGELKSGDVKMATVGQKSCCHVIYGLSAGLEQCCRPGLVEDGDKCVQHHP